MHALNFDYGLRLAMSILMPQITIIDFLGSAQVLGPDFGGEFFRHNFVLSKMPYSFEIPSF
jgi:hypothetical protein